MIRPLEERKTALVPFRPDAADAVLRWASTASALFDWCGRRDFPLTDASVFASWHREPGVSAFLMELEARPAGYGEVWVDESEREAELARIIVAPSLRGRGAGKILTRLLIGRAELTSYPTVWVRVMPANAAALGCYRAVGFERAPSAQEEAFNGPQPIPYAWLSRPLSGAAGCTPIPGTHRLPKPETRNPKPLT